MLSAQVKTRSPGLAFAAADVKAGDTVYVTDRTGPAHLRMQSVKVTSVADPFAVLNFKRSTGEWAFGGPVVDAEGRVVGLLLPPEKRDALAKQKKHQFSDDRREPMGPDKSGPQYPPGADKLPVQR